MLFIDTKRHHRKDTFRNAVTIFGLSRTPYWRYNAAGPSNPGNSVKDELSGREKRRSTLPKIEAHFCRRVRRRLSRIPCRGPDPSAGSRRPIALGGLIGIPLVRGVKAARLRLASLSGLSAPARARNRLPITGNTLDVCCYRCQLPSTLHFRLRRVIWRNALVYQTFISSAPG